MARRTVENPSEVPDMKRIGVIGGVGQWATMDVLNRMLKYSANNIPQYGNRGYPPMDIRMLNEAPVKVNPDGSIVEPVEASDELIAAAKYVGQDSDFIIMLANTPHLCSKQVEEAAGKPLLSIVDLTIEELLKRKVKKVGVLAIGPTIDGRLYQDPLEKAGMEVLVLPKDKSEDLDRRLIWPIQEGSYLIDARTELLYQAEAYFREQGAEGIILGCTELPIVHARSTFGERKDIINPSKLLAEAAVERALS